MKGIQDLMIIMAKELPNELLLDELETEVKESKITGELTDRFKSLIMMFGIKVGTEDLSVEETLDDIDKRRDQRKLFDVDKQKN